MIPNKITDIVLPAYYNNEFIETNLESLVDDYLILIFYPYDFTFVCPTELNAISDQYEEFSKLNTNVVFISCDSIYSHKAWSNIDPKEGGIKGIKYHMISDYNKKLTKQLCLLNDDGACKRATVIIDNNMNILHYHFNINPIGRSTKELKRIIKALKFNKNTQNICKVDWDE
ncbi:thioredoxin peroxidase [Tubulinosema ratisbonensis]|uniref:Thioredoxin peroxidase n=1 Tax=Tubulinosema ratisbonensis TaxID=291195 RepID=A0A437AP46_9MICR|nr:thioredoxin peroxidase [Tubulinosema ratisbonensis]